METLTVAEKKARGVVDRWSIASMPVSLIPGGMFMLGAGDWAMVRRVAAVFEVKEWSPEEVVAGLSGFVTSKLIAEGIGAVPLVGWVAKAGLAVVIRKAAGEFIVNHFKAISPLRD